MRKSMNSLVVGSTQMLTSESKILKSGFNFGVRRLAAAFPGIGLTMPDL
jgi:hypothetical protein